MSTGGFSYWFALQTAPGSERTTTGWVLWAALAAVLLGLYLLNRRSRRRADDAYWRRRAFEDRLKANDPDLAPDYRTDAHRARSDENDADDDEGGTEA